MSDRLKAAAEAAWDNALIAWGQDTTRREILDAIEQALAPFFDKPDPSGDMQKCAETLAEDSILTKDHIPGVGEKAGVDVEALVKDLEEQVDEEGHHWYENAGDCISNHLTDIGPLKAQHEELLSAIKKLPEDPEGDGPDERVGYALKRIAELRSQALKVCLKFDDLRNIAPRECAFVEDDEKALFDLINPSREEVQKIEKGAK